MKKDEMIDDCESVVTFEGHDESRNEMNYEIRLDYEGLSVNK